MVTIALAPGVLAGILAALSAVCIAAGGYIITQAMEQGRRAADCPPEAPDAERGEP